MGIHKNAYINFICYFKSPISIKFGRILLELFIRLWRSKNRLFGGLAVFGGVKKPPLNIFAISKPSCGEIFENIAILYRVNEIAANS